MSNLMTRYYAHVSVIVCSQLARLRMSEEDPVFQISGTCALITYCFLWSQKCSQNGWKTLIQLPSLLQDLPQAEMTSRSLKGWWPFFPSLTYLFFFLPLVASHERLEHSKVTEYMGKGRRTTYAQGKSQAQISSEMFCLHLRLILTTETAWNNTKVNKNNNNNKPWGREIILFPEL